MLRSESLVALGDLMRQHHQRFSHLRDLTAHRLQSVQCITYPLSSEIQVSKWDY